MRRSITIVLAIALAFTLSLTQAGSFATYHPDQTNRDRGFDAYSDGEFPRALDYFRRAARYADKPSQLAISMMYRHGEGVSADPVLAYVWADLAAERGYVSFLAYREEIWSKLSEEQQQRAVDIGQAMYAEFGDEVAKPRLNQLLQRGLAKRTGSHAGSDISPIGVAQLDSSARANLFGRLLVLPHGSVASSDFSLRVLSQLSSEIRAQMAGGYYNEAHWKPAAYWTLQDAIWSGRGTVEVGPLRKAGNG